MRTVWILLWFLALVLTPASTSAAEGVTLYLFHAKGCTSCMQEEAFLAGLQQRVPGLTVRSFEVRLNPENAALLLRAGEAFGVKAQAVPVTFVGRSEPVLGYRSDETTGRLIEERVRGCLAGGEEDVVGPIVDAGVAGPPPTRATLPGAPGNAGAGRPAAAQAPGASDTVVWLPLLGRTDFSGMPLVALTVILGALDSFNPCAFFVLLTLLGILVHARSRARMLAVGGIFVLLSGVVYFVFMAAWLNVFLLIGELRAVTTAAGIVALGVASINIKDYFLFKRGISLTIPESKKPRLFERMRGLVHESRWPALIAATAVLAVAANTYELLCTAGFPLVFTRILTLSSVPPVVYYGYLALYNLVYILPLAGVVAVFSLTLGARKLTEEQGRAMKLVSGLMMLGLGGIVLVDPSLFNNLLVGVGLLALALALAAAIIGLEHRRKRHGGQPHLAGLARGGAR